MIMSPGKFRSTSKNSSESELKKKKKLSEMHHRSVIPRALQSTKTEKKRKLSEAIEIALSRVLTCMVCPFGSYTLLGLRSLLIG